MANFDVARDALNTSLESSGSAMIEHGKWSDSLEARLNKLKATWQSFAQSFLNSNLLKGGIEALRVVVGLLDGLVKNFGTLGTVALGVIGKGIYSGVKEVRESAKASAENAAAKAAEAEATEMSAAAKVADTEATRESTAAEVAEAEANTVSSSSETAEANANVTSATSEASEAAANMTSAASEVAEADANAASAASELVESEANAASAASELAENEANLASITSEVAEAEANAASTAAETAEVMANTASAATEAAEATASLASAAAEAGESAIKASGGFAKFFGTLGGKVAIVAAAAAVIGLIYNQIKKAKEAAAELRQETIDASNEYLDSASSFEQVYIKYSGRTNLTLEEEAELESAIQGTVSALDDKSSALQNVVNSSNDYVASLEQIADAEIKEAARAAKAKKIAAEKSLNEIAIGYESFDGSEVNIELGRSSSEDLSSTNEAIKIAKELGGEYYKLDNYGKDLQGTIYTLTLRAGASTEEIIGYYYTLLDIQDALSDGYEDTDIYDNITEKIGEMSEAVEVYTNGVYEAVKAEYQLANGIPKTAEEYVKMREAVLGSDDIKGLSSNAKGVIADSLDSEYGKYFDLTSAEIQARKLIGVLDEYGDTEAKQVETFLNMRTAVNNNECTVGDYMSQFDKINEMTDGWSEEAVNELNMAFGIDTDKIKTQYDDIKKYLLRQVGTDEQRKMFWEERHLSPDNFQAMAKYAEELNKSEEEIEGFLNSLTASEFQAAINLKTKIDWDSTSEEIMAQIEEEAEFIEAVSFSVNLELEAEKLENLNTAISEAVSGAGLGSGSMSLVEDMFGDLDSYDASKLFERTANGIRMNSDEFRKLNDEYKNENIKGFDDKLSALGERYNQTMDELTDLTFGTDEYNEKLRDLDNLESQINATEQLASQYRGLTSAYQAWQMAESSGSQRDMYESILEGFENVDDEISRGWLDDGTIEFLRLIKGENISATATTKELVEAYKSLDDAIEGTSYSVKDFFTVDDDGNSTNDGVYNFLEAIDEKLGGNEIVQKDGSGNIIGFDFQVAGGDKAIADALGISEELVQIMVRAADDAGFVVSIDGTYQQLDTLKDKAQEAADKLKELGSTEFEFDINTGNKDSVFSQYEEALKIWETFKNEDGTVDMTVEGAEEAFTLVSTLQSMVDKLSEPAYMKLDTTQVGKDMKTPLSKLQEYERLVQQEHQLELKGADTSELDKSQEEILDYFDGLDPEIKAKLGIDNLSREQLEKKIEAGEINIPATIDLQVDMNNTLRDMVNVALYNAGLIDEEELKKRVKVELYAEEVDTSDVEGDIDSAVDGVVEQEEGNPTVLEKVVEITGIPIMDSRSHDIAEVIKGYTEEEQEVVLKFIADPSGYESYTPEEKEAVVKFIVDSLSVDNYTPEEKTAIAKYLIDGGDIDSYDPADKEAIVKFFTNTDDIDTWIPPVKPGEASYTPSLANTSLPSITGLTAWYTPKIKGASDVNGTANVNGTAFANGTIGKAYKHGDWGAKKTETALTGELGQELVVYGNRYWTVGDNGAEFATIPRGAIVFNHKQTEELFKNGRVTSGGGRGVITGGSALAEGTAYALYNSSGGSSGFGGIGRTSVKSVTIESDDVNVSDKSGSSSGSKGKDDGGGTGKSGKGKKTSSGSGGGGSSDAKNEFEEVIDWIEVAIARIEREIDNLDQKANNIYKSWSERNGALADEISEVGDEIELQQKAYDRYMQEAESVGLDASYAEMVRNGTIDIETITDEDLKKKIDDYKQWFEKALDCQDAIEDLKETEAELYQQRFENISTQYDGILGVIEHEKNMLDEYINQSETQGWLVSYDYYRALSSNEKKNIAELENQKADMLAELQAAMESGTIEKGSEAWYEMVNAIDEVSLSIAEANTRVMEISQTAQQLKWEQFDLLQDRISAITEETEFLIELLSSDKLYDDNGKLTDSGMATMGQHGVAYNTYMQQADQARAEAERIKAEMESGLYGGTDKYDTELEERYREMISLQQEHILAAQGEKEAIRDMVEEGIQLELDALQERIDKYNEALDSQKDLYKHQKKVKEQTEEIASLEKQMAAYSGDDSEEAKQKVQKLKVDLESAREELQETEYDRYISDQQQMLDELYAEYEEVLNTRLDNLDALVSDMISEVNASASTISSTLSEKAESVGYVLSDSMKTIWDSNTVSTTNVITTYGEKFSSAQTTTNNALNTINSNLQNMISYLSAMAKINVKSASTSSAVNSKEANAKKEQPKEEQPKKEQSKETNKEIKVGGKINAAGAKIYGEAGGTYGQSQYYKNDPIYTVLQEKNGYLLVRYHKLSSGYTGWFKKSDVKAYATGARKIDSDDMAWTQEKGDEFIVRPSDGAILTPVAKRDSILNAAASNNIWNMANSPAEFIKDNLNLGSASVPNSSTVHSSYIQNFENVTFSMPNVHGYSELLAEMQRDKNFEKLILSMSIDRLAGKSALAKGKSIR